MATSDWRALESGIQARSREANELTARASAHESSPPPLTSYHCECGDRACTCAIRLTTVEYELVRGCATHFAIARNHENPESELLIEEHRRFAVVETISREASHLARESNPRQWSGDSGSPEVELLNEAWHAHGAGPAGPPRCPICDRRVSADDHPIRHGGELYHPGCKRRFRRQRS
jgi:hypothetical protein